MPKVRIGVIGCGSINKYRHAPEFASHPDVEIVAFADINLKRAQGFAAKYGGTAYEKWQDVVAIKEIDAISVCTPNTLHAPMSIAASEAGKHVLCEKPMATSAEEAAAMIAAARRAGKFLMIGHNQRLAGMHVKAKALLDSGVIGKIVTFRTSFSHPGPEGWSADGAESWFFRKKEAFVGSMGDLGVHKADLLLWLLGEDIVEVSAFVDHIGKPFGDVDDNAVCILRTKSGAIGSLTASWTHNPGEDNATIVYGTKGILRIGVHPDYSVTVGLANGEKQFFQTGRVQTNDEGGQAESGVIRAFIQAITTGTAPEISGEEGHRALSVILACLESSETGKHVTVKYAQ